MIPLELIDPPIELRTKDPLLVVNSRHPTATLDLRPVQKRLHKRLTKGVKNMHEAKLYADMAELGFGKID